MMLDPTIAEIAPMLYVPANRPGLAAILRGEKQLGVCAVAVCLEDAVLPADRSQAAVTLAKALRDVPYPPPRPIFIRPADLEMLNRLMDSVPGALVSGYILPKATTTKISAWADSLNGYCPFLPILEGRQALEPMGRHDLVQACAQHRSQIPRIRIGANDLLALLGGLRRPPGKIIYETALGRVIDALIESFSCQDLPLCGPVFDRTGDVANLRRECEEDHHRGLFAKTALNPEQVNIIWQATRPSATDLDAAEMILKPDCPAVFSLHGSMHEPSCHTAWAQRIVRREKLHQQVAHSSILSTEYIS